MLYKICQSRFFSLKNEYLTQFELFVLNVQKKENVTETMTCAAVITEQSNSKIIVIFMTWDGKHEHLQRPRRWINKGRDVGSGKTLGSGGRRERGGRWERERKRKEKKESLPAGEHMPF